MARSGESPRTRQASDSCNSCRRMTRQSTCGHVTYFSHVSRFPRSAIARGQGAQDETTLRGTVTGVRECSNTTQPRLSTRPEVWEHCVLGVRWAYPVPTTSVTRASGERQLVGRAPDCDVVLSGPEISRHHAEMFRRGPLWVIRDLGSRNSIHINGHRIEQESLSPGDVLRIGEWIGVVRQVSLPFADDEVPFGEL